MGISLDRPAVDGSVIDVVIDRTDLVQHTHRFGNVPSNTVSYYAYGSLLRKHAATNLPPNFSGGAAPLPPTVTTYSSGSFADSHQFGASVDLDRNGDGNVDATVGVIRFLRNAADQLFDFGLTPLVPGDLTFNPGEAGRPVISWSNNDSRSTAQGLTLSHRSNTPQRIILLLHHDGARLRHRPCLSRAPRRVGGLSSRLIQQPLADDHEVRQTDKL